MDFEEKRLKNDLEFHQTGRWKFKMRCPSALSMNWAELHLLPLGHLRSGFHGKKLKNDFQGQPGDLQRVKNLLPHTSQIWRHQLLATPLLLDWSMMRNIHSLQIFTVWSYKPPEHSSLGSLFQCCLKKRQKILDLTFWTAFVLLEVPLEAVHHQSERNFRNFLTEFRGGGTFLI